MRCDVIRCGIVLGCDLIRFGQYQVILRDVMMLWDLLRLVWCGVIWCAIMWSYRMWALSCDNARCNDMIGYNEAGVASNAMWCGLGCFDVTWRDIMWSDAMCRDMMRCGMMRCDVTWHVCCVVLWCNVIYDVLWCDVTWCDMYLVVSCGVVWRNGTWCDVTEWNVKWRDVTRRYVIWCCVKYETS